MYMYNTCDQILAEKSVYMCIMYMYMILYGMYYTRLYTTTENKLAICTI